MLLHRPTTSRSSRFGAGRDDELAKFIPQYLALTLTDPRAGMLAARYKVMHCGQVVSDEVLRSSAMHKEALSPGGVEYSMCFTVPVVPDMVCLVSVMRGPDHAPFTADDCADFSCLVPHVGRAVTMHGAFQRCREELATVKALLDGVLLGLMVVDDGELKVANRAARMILDEGDAVRLHNDGCRGRRGAPMPTCDAVQDARSGTDQPFGLALPIDPAEPMRTVIRRLHPASAGLLGAPREAVALYVTDPCKPVETPEEVLQRLFGLTAREAAVLRLGDERRGNLQRTTRRYINRAPSVIAAGTLRFRVGSLLRFGYVREVSGFPSFAAGSVRSVHRTEPM